MHRNTHPSGTDHEIKRSAATDDPDRYVSLAKRGNTRFFQLLPIRPIL